MQSGAATVEHSMEFPQNIKNGSAFWASGPENRETPVWKNICTPMVKVVLLTMAKICKQPNCPAVEGVD